SFAWLQSTPALVALGTAAVLETLAFYIPGLDHLLDVLAGPLAVVAGVVASVSVMVDVPPEIRWPIAVIAGGGIAALTKGTTAVIRAKTAAMTGGLGNPVVSTAETAGAATVSILAIVAPLICLLGAIAIVVWAIRRVRLLPECLVSARKVVDERRLLVQIDSIVEGALSDRRKLLDGCYPLRPTR